MKNLFVILCFIHSSLVAQDQPISHLYSLDFTLENDSFALTKISFLSDFNDTGFNGHFDINANNQIIYAANAILGRSGTTEIVLLDTELDELTILTNNNRLDDYPRFIGNESYITTQTFYDESILTIRSLKNSIQGERILNGLSNIISATNMDDDAFILHLRNDLDYIAVAYESDDSFKILEANVGPHVRRFTDTQFFYVHKIRPDSWNLKRYDIEFLKKKSIVEIPVGVDDFDLLPDGSFIIAKDARLMRYNPLTSNEWVVIEDLSSFGISQISEIGVGNGKIVICSQPK